MRNLKKFLALVLAMMMVFSLMITASAADATSSEDGTAYKPAYEKLYEYGVVQGTDNKDDPASLGMNFTRAQMAGIAYHILTGDVDDKDITLQHIYAAEQFPDMDQAKWAKGYVGFCANHGIIIGDDKGNFNPNDDVTGYQVATLMLRMLGYGKNKEFTGSNWALNAGSLAYQKGITAGLLSDVDLGAIVNRGVSCQMALNAATKVSTVKYDGVVTYAETGTKLIDVKPGTPKTEQDEFGALVKTTPATTITFTWKDGGVEKKLNDASVTDLAKGTWYTPVLECDVYEKSGASTDTFKAVTYTNGIYNENLDSNNIATGKPITIEKKDTTNAIGGYGRVTALYANDAAVTGIPVTTAAYIVVYKDIFLAEVTGVVDAVKDKEQHIVNDPGTYGKVYAPTDISVTPPSTTVRVPDAYTVSSAPYAGFRLSEVYDDTFTKGDMLTVYAITYPADTDEAFAVGKRGNVFSTTDKKDGIVTTGKVAADAKIVPTEVKVDANKSVSALNNLTGFVGTDGTTYTYSWLFPQPSTQVPDSFEGKLLPNFKINATFKVYTDGHGNVLALKDATPGNSYGVVSSYDIEKVSADPLKYAVTLQVKTTDGNVPIRIAATYTSEAAARAAGNLHLNQLINYVPSSENYNVSMVQDQNHTEFPARIIQEQLVGQVLAGQAMTLADASNASELGVTKRVNSDTVFFVADYRLQDSTVGYEFLGYSVKQGFKAIADRLSVDNETRWRMRIDSNDIGDNLIVSYVDYNVDGWLDYVLIKNATKVETFKDAVPSDFAYIFADSVHVYDNYYLYKAVVNGEDTELKVAYGSITQVLNNGIYELVKETNGEWTIAFVGANSIADGLYDSKSDVLWDTNPAILNPDGTVRIPARTLHGVDRTLADNVAIYIVNDMTWKSYTAGTTDVDSILAYYSSANTDKACDIFWQTDKDGYIDLIYIVDNNIDPSYDWTDPGTPAAPVTLTLKGDFLTADATKNTPDTYKEGTNLLKTTSNVLIFFGAENHTIADNKNGVPVWDHHVLSGVKFTTTANNALEITFTSAFNGTKVYFIDGVKVVMKGNGAKTTISIPKLSKSITLDLDNWNNATTQALMKTSVLEHTLYYLITFDHKYLDVQPKLDTTVAYTEGNGKLYIPAGTTATIVGKDGYTGAYWTYLTGTTPKHEATSGDITSTTISATTPVDAVTTIASDWTINAVAKLSFDSAQRARAYYYDEATSGDIRVTDGNYVVIGTGLTVTTNYLNSEGVSQLAVIDSETFSAIDLVSTAKYDYTMPAKDTKLNAARQISYNQYEISVKAGTTTVPTASYVNLTCALTVTPIDTTNTDLNVIAVNNKDRVYRASGDATATAALASTGVGGYTTITTNNPIVYLKLAVPVKVTVSGAAATSGELRVTNGDAGSERIGGPLTANVAYAYVVPGTRLVASANKTIKVTGHVPGTESDVNGVVSFNVSNKAVTIALS